MLVFQEIDTLLIVGNCTFCVPVFEFGVAVLFVALAFSHFLLIAELPFLFLFVSEVNKFNIEVQGGVRRYFGWWSSCSIGIFWGADERGLLSFEHAGEPLVPSFDDAALP